MFDREVRKTSRQVSRVAALVGVLLVLLTPSVALASRSSTCQGYNPQLCSSLGSGSSGTGTSSRSPSSASTGGTLPFTGLDVVLLVSGAAGLSAAGIMLRWLSRQLG